MTRPGHEGHPRLVDYADYLREHAYNHLVGRVDRHFEQTPDLEELREMQWSEEFDEGCMHRMVMGGFRYGSFEYQMATGRTFKNVQSIIARAQLYEETGDLEILFDIANLARIEFKQQRPRRPVKSTDDGIHAER